jgi:hypothetical protein
LVDLPGSGPIEKLRHGLSVGRARVFISDVGGKELDEPPGGLLAGARDTLPAAGRGLRAGGMELE